MRLRKVEKCWYIVMVGTLFSNRCSLIHEVRSIRLIGGISISPAFVVMFVMEHFRLSCDDALHMVQNRRYCISPNGGFLSQIKVWIPRVCLSGLGLSTPIPQEYEAIYRAAMAVGSQPAAQRQNRRKREEDSDDEE